MYRVKLGFLMVEVKKKWKSGREGWGLTILELKGHGGGAFWNF